MKTREVAARRILSRSRVFDYTLNPYTGCAYGCTYCYARFMKRFAGRKERWGEFVDVKLNAPELLVRETERKRRAGRVWVSGVCDPYQPVERRCGLTRRCLEILTGNGWPVTVQTKSPLVLRDLDLLKCARGAEVGLTVTTADEGVRVLFEPKAPRIEERISALSVLRSEGVRTFAMIAPLLPGAGGLVELLKGRVDYVLIDRMNYHHADWVYRKYALEWAAEAEFFMRTGRELRSSLEREGIPCEVLFLGS